MRPVGAGGAYTFSTFSISDQSGSGTFQIVGRGNFGAGATEATETEVSEKEEAEEADMTRSSVQNR